MMLSHQLMFSDGQALTATAASENVIDLGAPGTVLGAPAALKRDVGRGVPVPFVVVLGAAAGGTSPTIRVDLEISDTSDFSSAETVLSSAVKSGGAAGDRIELGSYLPDGTDKRYMRLNYTLGGSSPTYTVTAGIVAGRQSTSGLVGV